MANIIKKISGVDLSGNTVIADAAVTNMYTDENGDLNIKTSTELGDTEDSKVVITSKEINLNADTVKVNGTDISSNEDSNTVEITDYMHEGDVLPNAKIYTYDNTIISEYFCSNPGFNQYIVFKVNTSYIVFTANVVIGSTPGSIPQVNGYKYAGTTTTNSPEGSEEESLYNQYIKSCNGDTVPGEQSYVYSGSKGLMTLDDKNAIALIALINSHIEEIDNDIQGIDEYLVEVSKRVESLEEAISEIRRAVDWNQAAIQKIADHLNYEGIYETE